MTSLNFLCKALSRLEDNEIDQKMFDLDVSDSEEEESVVIKI